MDEFKPWYQRLAGKVPEGAWTVVIAILFLCGIVGVIATLGYPYHNEEDTRRTLESAGYSDVEIRNEGGWFACGKGDFYKTPFTANNPNGKSVQGTVCCGMLTKDCTIRF